MSHAFLQIGLWAMTALVLVSAVFVVALGNLFRAALSLGLVLVGVAGLFVLLEAEFLAFVQILIYVGAILTLVVFAIMLTPPPVATPGAASSMAMRGSSSRATGGGAPASRRWRSAAAVSGALFVLLAMATHALVPDLAPAPPAVSLSQLGQELVTTLVLPFEVISLVFVAAMVGAIVVAASGAPGPRSSPTITE